MHVEPCGLSVRIRDGAEGFYYCVMSEASYEAQRAENRAPATIARARDAPEPDPSGLDVERWMEIVSDSLAATTEGTDWAEAPEPSDEPGSPCAAAHE